jgi:predicted dinucleotide-binding enzyme
MKSKIGIIGSGAVGQALANGFLKHGYSVLVGTRDPSKLNEWKSKAGKNASVGSFAEAASFGEIIVLAVKGTVARHCVELAGVKNLVRKTVIDATNPIADLPSENGVIRFFTDLKSSLLEQLQSDFPEINFVKAFNSIGYAVMVNPDFGGLKPSMFICGNNDGAKKEVAEIVALFGFEVEDMGHAEAARAIEPLCILWCIPGMLKNEWTNRAFKMLRK